MKIAITGHTKGIGKAIAGLYYTDEVVGFSRSNGYDISVEESISRIVAESIECDIFVNNFTNNLYKIGNDICTENNIPFEILLPLIKETAEKITRLSPLEAQTGPAIRNDEETINSHLEFLTNENQKNIYKILTQSIQHNGKKL